MKGFIGTCSFDIFSSYTRLANPNVLLDSAVTLSFLQSGSQGTVNTQTHALSTESDPWNG